MKIAVLGSTGPTGQEIVRQALAAGLEVAAVSRREFPFTHSHLHVVRGEAIDPAVIRTASEGAHAVLSALGSRDMKHATTIYSQSAKAVDEAAMESGVRRFICISASPVTPKERKQFFNRYITDPILGLFFGGGYADMARMEKLLENSSLQWTVFRPPYLSNQPARGHYRSALDAPVAGGFTLTRSDLAAAMLAAIDEVPMFYHTVNIAN